jgi:hypothetical protein
MNKLIPITMITLALAGAAVAAPPAPSLNLVSTNTPFTDQTIVTNVAVAMPVGRWTNAVVYAPVTSLKQGTQLVWNASAGAVGYAVYYGDVLTNATNKFDVAYNTSAVFFGLSTNTTYFFYATAYDVARAESPPSALVIFKPGS